MDRVTDTLITLPIWSILVVVVLGFFVVRALYNISPFHPLAKYPGPLLWRAFRLPSAYHWAKGDIMPYLAAMHKRYGHTVRLAPDELSYATPEAWQPIYNARPQLQKSDFVLGGFVDVEEMPPAMILAPDDDHARLRRLMSPAFLNSGVFAVEPTLQYFSDLLCSQLARASQEGPQDVKEWFTWTLSDLISHLALDTDFECLKQRRLHPWPGLLLGMFKQAAKINFCRRYGLQLWMVKPLIQGKLKQQRDDFMNTAKSLVSQRLSKTTTTQQNGRPDMIGLLLGEMKSGDTLSEVEILSNSIMLVAAGTETTSTTLSTTVYYLCKFPRVMQKLKEEIRGTFLSEQDITLKAMQESTYLTAILEEAWRIFPQTGVIPPRIVPKGGHLINGEIVPGGTTVSVSQVFMGSSDKFFDNPEDFRPERWLNGGEVQKASGLRPDQIMKPFSLGPRNCAGKLLAYAEARLVITKLLWHFDIELDGDHANWVQDARVFVAWELGPLMARLTPVHRAASEGR